MEARTYVGTSGWNYKHWRNLIYPERMPQKNWLNFIAGQFDTIELNTSFYRIPTKESVAAWCDATPPQFLFAMKLWRGITHFRKLRNSEQFTANFLDVAQMLPSDRRGPLLIQLPPNQGKDVAKLVEYVRTLRRLSDFQWRVAVEFRNGNWLDDETYRALDAENVAICLHDMVGKADTDEPNGADFIYVRRHGTNGGRYAGSYSPRQLQADANRIQSWNRAGKCVFVYYNNDIGGHAFWNARDLRRRLESDGDIMFTK